MFVKPDLRETEFYTLTSIDFAISGVKAPSARVRDDNGLAAHDVALRDEVVAAAGVSDPEDTVCSAHGRNATLILDDKL